MLNSFQKKPFFIRLFNWEYWNMYFIYAPVFFYYLYLSLKARSFFFFTAANPSIITGGLVGESKIEIIKDTPAHLQPKTVFVAGNTPFVQVCADIAKCGIVYPLIVKPDVGQRGLLVAKIPNEKSLQTYHTQNGYIDLLVQDFVALPLELSVLHYRFPNQTSGKISSLTIKEFLSVTGNGSSTLQQLIDKNPRAILQKERLAALYNNEWQQIVPQGVTLVLEPIGNHSRGTKFINGNPFIDKQLTQVFDQISHSLTDIYFCRYDMKCTSLEDLKLGKNIQIMEINGVGAEPAHIYQPGYPLLKAFADLLAQWKIIYQISVYNNQHLKVPYMSYAAFKTHFKQYQSYMKQIEQA